ncbi:hypothetical protein HRbin30_01299 [bacterium HR30]|nr:hypothetical protein HRbin30_01299 [bacterium HR30]
MRSVQVVAVVIAFVGVALGRVRATRAEPERGPSGVPALVAEQSPAEKSRLLAARAIALLKQAEDATDPNAKRQLYQQGLELANAALELDEQNADAHFARFATKGRLLLLDGASPNPLNLMRLNRDLDRALELNPNHADALAAKGGLYRQLPRLLGGSERKAEECLTKAIALEPDHAVGARIELAQLYFDRGERERAVALLKKAITIAERDGKVRQRNEAQALLERYVGAIREHR